MMITRPHCQVDCESEKGLLEISHVVKLKQLIGATEDYDMCMFEPQCWPS